MKLIFRHFCLCCTEWHLTCSVETGYKIKHKEKSTVHKINLTHTFLRWRVFVIEKSQQCQFYSPNLWTQTRKLFFISCLLQFGPPHLFCRAKPQSHEWKVAESKRDTKKYKLTQTRCYSFFYFALAQNQLFGFFFSWITHDISHITCTLFIITYHGLISQKPGISPGMCGLLNSAI